MNRATPMAPEERRQHIIAATVPLIIEYGPEVPTRAIASAAGIAEGTIFRAFDTKEELIHLSLHAALRPDQAITTLNALETTHTLDERVVAILDTLQAEITRTHALFAHFPKWGKERRAAAGRPRHERHRPGPPPHMRENHERLMLAVSQALSPFQEQLQVSVTMSARVLTALAFSSRFSVADETDDPRELAGIVLHGIAARPMAPLVGDAPELSAVPAHPVGGRA